MTTRLSIFDHPFFLGFDHFEREFDRLKKTTDAYPPYNVEQIGENGLRITLAVAGFSRDDLEIDIENNQLTIRGRLKDEAEKTYLHRGIAGRQFQRNYVLADGIEIKGATLDNGLLHIDMQRVQPETVTRRIEISQASKLNGNRQAMPQAIGVDRDGKTQTQRRADQ